MKKITELNHGELKELDNKLNGLYWNNGLTQEEIGKIFGVSGTTISNWMEMFKIPIRNLREAAYRSLGKPMPNLGMSELWDLYVKRGINVFEIADKYNMGVSTIYKWLNEMSAPKQHTKNPNLNLSPELTYILAVLLGDGNVHRSVNAPHSISYYMRLSVKDQPFAESFAEALKEIGLNPNVYKSRGHNGSSDYINVKANSVIFYNWYKSLSWGDIIRIGDAYPLDFIRGMYESEGSYYIQKQSIKQKEYYSKYLYPATNKNYKLLQFIATLLKEYGFDTSFGITKKRGYEDSYRLYLKGGERERKRFVSLINPSIKREAMYNGQ